MRWLLLVDTIISQLAFLSWCHITGWFWLEAVGMAMLFLSLCSVAGSGGAVNPHCSGRITGHSWNTNKWNKKWSNQNLLGDYDDNVEGEHRSQHHQLNPATGGWDRITFCAVHNTRVTLIIQVWAYVKLEIKRKGYETITSHMKLSVFLQLHFEPKPLKFLG